MAIKNDNKEKLLSHNILQTDIIISMPHFFRPKSCLLIVKIKFKTELTF